MAVNGYMVIMKKIILISATLFCSHAGAGYVEVSRQDINKPQFCETSWVAEIYNDGCDTNLSIVHTLMEYLPLKDFIPYKKDNEVYFQIKNHLTDTVVGVRQEIPLDYSVSTFKNEFYGTFWGRDEQLDLHSWEWRVLCDTKNRKCIVSSEVLSLSVESGVIQAYINPNLYISSIEIFDSKLKNPTSVLYKIYPKNNEIDPHGFGSTSHMVVEKTIKNITYRDKISLAGIDEALDFANWSISKMK